MDNDLLCESKDFEVVVQKRKNARKSTPGIVPGTEVKHINKRTE